jgi:hypothetical protein
MTSTILRLGLDANTCRRFTISARAVDSWLWPNHAFQSWFDSQRRVNEFEVDRIPF